MAYVDDPGPAPRFRFTAYADDTPRSPAFDHFAIGQDGLTDDGDASDWEYAAPPEPAGPRYATRRVAALLAVATAIAVAAFLATTVIRQSRTPAPLTASSPAAAAAELQVPGAPAPAAGDVETLPEAPRSLAPNALAAASPEFAERPLIAPRPDAGRGHGAQRKSVPAAWSGPTDCARPTSRAQRMVCHSPRLLAADRRMTHAYAEAKALGAPPRALRRDQMRWLAARDAAARRSRSAVERLYSDRTRALQSRPYGACAGYAAGARRGWGLGRVAHWFLPAPGRMASARGQADCGPSRFRGR